MEKKHGQMGQFMKGISKMVKNTEKAYFNGLTERLIMESLGTTTLKVMGFTCGQIKDDMRESGKTIKWKETVCSHGLMDDPTKVLTVMIRKKEQESFDGRMERNIMGNGMMVFNMDTVKLSKKELMRKDNKQIRLLEEYGKEVEMNES